ncbi:DEAD/DEAH box helicase [Sulfurimonas autotrophica]|uniref:DEAD/DEAH box helicase domain protein n=1 Tax=Sulfurimonas autotrophica (strain ATCC BAA-671 / DSM 16294 / JCM 11897 / OK10) TaxID=563040 RepID=E0USZ0_SULAO|nr:DEAD/DEAH box helicase [Sulfurimonas autotrophica]ADN09231.1 DEAD/DEAH box helicase domain protein [Sulfurimonas autotrophica DSM 16294]
MPFSTLNLSSTLQKTLQDKGFKKPTPIQEKVIPLVLNNKDVIAQAQTGSGKSASFVLPLLQLWSQKRDNAKKGKIKILVLTPTRELTLQVAEVFEEFSKDLAKKPQIVSLIGGESIGEQLYNIQQGCDVLVATSGRFLDVLKKKQMNLSHLNYLVLDEADKMLNFDFTEELDLVLESLPAKRQNLLFSATYPPKMLDLVSKIMSNPLHVTIEQKPTVENIRQRVIEVDNEKRGPLLRHLLKEHKYKRVLVFMANKRATDNIAEKFRKYGIEAASFNADLEQDIRNDTLQAFKEAKINVLFATDIAARGLDIDNIDCIINYDLPRSPADYIHRIGRTARAGKSGEAISFINHETQEHFKLIEKRSHIKLTRESIQGFELTGEAPKKVKGPAPVKGKGKSKKDKLREIKLRNGDLKC